MKKIAFFLACYYLFLPPLSAQSNFGSEAELKKQASKFFDKEDYVSASPLYSQLISVYPANPQYNYRFGTCLLFADRDKAKAIGYLKTASASWDRPNDVWYFLGKAYHLNYQFDEAIQAFEEFKKQAKKKELDLLNPDRQIEMCNNAKMLIQSSRAVQICGHKNRLRM